MIHKKSDLVAPIGLVLMILLFLSPGSLGAEYDSAWQALHDMDITGARSLFEKALEEQPDNVELMRGMMITAYLDCDQETYFEMIDKMIKADPSNPYLMAVFEHEIAMMKYWKQAPECHYKIGKALSESSNNSLSYLGKRILESYYQFTLEKMPKNLGGSFGYAPGCWVIGPFNNESNIAAYMRLPLENSVLDTMATAVGKQGARVGWTWLESSESGDFYPSIAMESRTEVAVQMRFFFDLPLSQKILILTGGVYSCRMLIDGEKVHDDPILRNAHQRFGIEAKLTAGAHEITVILGSEYGGMSLSLAILDENYKPLENLTWLRYAEQIDGKVTNHRSFNPIFETFNAYAEKKPSPDEHYFRNILQIYNGYAKEAVQELEKLQSSQGLSILETLSLTDALARNGETELSIEYLNQIHEKTSTPLTDHRWISQTIDDYEAAINAFSELREHYPGRADLELTASLKPLLNNETKTLFENLETCKKKYPDYVAVYDLLSKMYLEYLDDPESAYDEFKEYCERAKSGYRYLSEASDYFIRMRNYEKALKKAYEAYEYYPFSEGALSQLMYSSKLARKEKELIPLFKELIEKFPYNIDNHSRLFFIYENAGMFDEAQRIMEEIHYIKPSAVMPHQRIDSLHNGIDYDSIFGSIDAMDFWDREPSEEDQGNNNIWSLIDRQQTIVFESGLVFKDYHSGYVLTDQAAVESMQEFNFGFDPSDGFNTLISARRLRKGQPPLSGEVLGSYVVFKDLKPGDAIEFHYRRWSQNSGELWQHFWKSYLVNASYYQRYMEFTILTNRDDLIYYADSIAGEPTTHDTYCGFRRISWKRENLSARKLDLEVLPPQDDILGKIFVSTLPGWNVFNRWYKSISDAILYDNPRSKKLALELTADMESDFNKMSALYEHIVEDIPYQQIGFDYDASIPQKPDQVLVNGWGDCKDKSHLLIKMLHTCGIEAWPVLTMSRYYGTNIPIPYFGFNHMITGAIIDGDTIFIDPTDVSFPPRYSITSSLTGQPIINVSEKEIDSLDFLRKEAPTDHRIDRFIKLKYVDSTQFDVTSKTLSYNMQAGYRRSSLKQFTPGEFKSSLESSVSDSWGIRLVIDSVFTDPDYGVDTIFNERWYGRAFINIQDISDIRIIRMPDLSYFEKAFISRLTDNGSRELPVDLRDYCSSYNIEVTVETPESYGAPEIGDDLELADSLYSFKHYSEWNPESRRLILHYKYEISDGLTEPWGFISFVQKVTEAFDKPIVFKAE